MKGQGEKRRGTMVAKGSAEGGREGERDPGKEVMKV
jgi:hypothetical protein